MLRAQKRLTKGRLWKTTRILCWYVYLHKSKVYVWNIRQTDRIRTLDRCVHNLVLVIPLIITEFFLYKIYVDIGTGLIIHNLHAVLVIKQDGSWINCKQKINVSSCFILCAEEYLATIDNALKLATTCQCPCDTVVFA